MESIIPLIQEGHIHFGENKVQEAIYKWSDTKVKYKNLKLHLVGKLQTNKVKFVLPLFDYIHSLDSIKLAEKISAQQKKIGIKPKIFIQINIGNEKQKSGINKNDLEIFLDKCFKEYDLDIIGLMCIPPNDGKSEYYFSEMKKLTDKFRLKDISMGMSDDYLEAIKNGATFIRIGSKIFGERT